MDKIGLGGGCHWCTEGVFASLRGVERVEQGWIASVAPDDAFSEAVIVHYDPRVVSLAELIGVHLETHSATGDHRLRSRYRSAVYCFGGTGMETVPKLLEREATALSGKLLTRVLPYAAFRPSLAEHLDYYYTDPQRPFCRRYIAPKLAALRQKRPGILSDRAAKDAN